MAYEFTIKGHHFVVTSSPGADDGYPGQTSVRTKLVDRVTRQDVVTRYDVRNVPPDRQWAKVSAQSLFDHLRSKKAI